jgi:LDH2 family malate/lactate/ureidoglycolate dehydrogenase
MVTRGAEELRSLGEAIFVAAGASPENAGVVMHSLIGANLAGHDSHGVIRIPSYIEEIKKGRLQPAAMPVVVQETPSTATIDGAQTFGQVGAKLTAATAARKASEVGLGAATARGCFHTGRIGEWTELGASQGFITFAAAANADGALRTVAPFGGKQINLGTNPCSWAIPRPGGKPPILLDYATSAAARGKLLVARAAGRPVPDGWIVDRDGRPTTDAEDFFTGGMLLSFGGHKVYALSAVVEMLAVGLSGGQRIPAGGGASTIFLICIDPQAFQLEADFYESIESVAARLAATPPADGVEAVLLPGDPETRNRTERLAAGIPLAESTWGEITTIARDLGVAHPAVG